MKTTCLTFSLLAEDTRLELVLPFELLMTKDHKILASSPEGLFTRFYFCKIRNSYNIPTRQWDSNPQLPILFIGIKAFSRNRTYIHPHDKSMGYLPLNYKGISNDELSYHLVVVSSLELTL